MSEIVRPTKKQQRLLEFIGTFITEHGYSPSYREIMDGCGYTSVATVSLHVNNLIRRGHLRKRDHSARSIELAQNSEPAKIKSNEVAPSEEKWLVEKVEYFISRAEQVKPVPQTTLDELHVLLGALKVLGMEGAAQSFSQRVQTLKANIETL